MNQQAERAWVRACSLESLQERARVFKHGEHQLAIFRLDGGEVHAIDNRCPHEGYPLAPGALKEGILTCEWHNWKFRLCDGECLLGGEDVRSYPIRLDDEDVWVDLTEPDNAREVPKLQASLLKALDENDMGHAARTVQRWLALQGPLDILGFVAAKAARRARYGFDHGLATAADLAESIEDFPGQEALPLMQAISLLWEPNLRRPDRSVAEPVKLPQEPEDALLAKVEAEDIEGAQAILRGMLARGRSFELIWRSLNRAATDHFLGYGHGHIYCVQAEALLQRIPKAHADEILSALVTSITLETREDRLPYMRGYQREMERHEPRLEALFEASRADAPWDHTALLQASTDGSLEEALEAVASSLERGAAPARVALVLAMAAARRLLRFDDAIARNPDLSEGWLHVTHALTHADAVWRALVQRPSAPLLRGLFYSARFIQHLKVLDQDSAEPELNALSEPWQEALREGIERSNPERALAAAQAGLREPATLGSALRRIAVEDHRALPIYMAHNVKTTWAALRLSRALRLDDGLRAGASLPILGTVRYLAHRVQERRVWHRARVASSFVQEHKMQTKLLGY